MTAAVTTISATTTAVGGQADGGGGGLQYWISIRARTIASSVDRLL